MKVVFLQDVTGDQAYTAGQQADVPDQLARPWIEQGIARPLDVTGVKAVTDAAITQITAAASADELEKVRIQYLGRNGEITLLSKGLGSIPAEFAAIMGRPSTRPSKERKRRRKLARQRWSGTPPAQRLHRRHAAGHSPRHGPPAPADADHGRGQNRPAGSWLSLRRLP